MATTDPAKPGVTTSEFWVTILKMGVALVIAVCSSFGVGIPGYLQNDSQWVTAAALLAATISGAVYTISRSGLKKTLTTYGPVVDVALRKALPAVTNVPPTTQTPPPLPAPQPDPPADAG